MLSSPVYNPQQVKLTLSFSNATWSLIQENVILLHPLEGTELTSSLQSTAAPTTSQTWSLNLVKNHMLLNEPIGLVYSGPKDANDSGSFLRAGLKSFDLCCSTSHFFNPLSPPNKFSPTITYALSDSNQDFPSAIVSLSTSNPPISQDPPSPKPTHHSITLSSNLGKGRRDHQLLFSCCL